MEKKKQRKRYEVYINGRRSHFMWNANKAMKEAFDCTSQGIVELYEVDHEGRRLMITLQAKPDKGL